MITFRIAAAVQSAAMRRRLGGNRVPALVTQRRDRHDIEAYLSEHGIGMAGAVRREHPASSAAAAAQTPKLVQT